MTRQHRAVSAGSELQVRASPGRLGKHEGDRPGGDRAVVVLPVLPGRCRQHHGDDDGAIAAGAVSLVLAETARHRPDLEF